ncbi:AGAP013331-PA [Anopheles gambiae str. PEST]|uniref:AGAP013331-PA n=2 Tax=gambiae species complex TaxID=44542 RepID=F5HLU0_ANOGA|nr:AGAP013331-PA [Anopheles gambiae str. PEST]
MPSVEPNDSNSESRECLSENGDYSSDMSTEATLNHDVPDPDRYLIPADRIEHSEQIEMPTEREFTQNDTINKFLLNSFLQRINDTSNREEQQHDPSSVAGAAEEREQDFDS